MGARMLYDLIKQDPKGQFLLEKTGRDKFEKILFTNGYRVKRIRDHSRTTRSGKFRFSNKISGKGIRELDHVWVSDITYLKMGTKHYYLTSMIDLYSRRILGYSCSNSMMSEMTSIPAMKMAIDVRNVKQFEKLVLHTDGGGQYYDKGFLELLKAYNIDSSMGKQASDNPFAERFNGTWKNDYLIPWDIHSARELDLKLKKFYFTYNFKRPHQSIGKMSPVTFENLITKTPVSNREILKLS